MKSYTFTGPKGEVTTVKAIDEERARHLAMVARWGLPSGIYGSLYRGVGLNLIEVK